MLLRQFVDEDLGCASYLVGDADAGEALLVDPAYAIEPYLAAAKAEGVRIVRVLETHTHADHVSGHGRLALEHGVPVSVHGEADAAYAHDPLADGDEISAGAVKARTIHTPGHRPEHCCFLVDGTLFTGDSLFVGTVARPDLAVEARTGAEGMFRSLQRLLELADHVQVFPGHVAGSLCGTGMSPAPSTTIGAERRGNALLAIATVSDFVDETAEAATPRPPNMERIVELNRGPFLGDSPALEPMGSPDDATVLDVRSAEEFAAGHVPGALNVPVAVKGFGTRSGFVLRRDERVVLYASTLAEAELAARRLRAVGVLELAGYLDGPQGLEPLGTVELDDLGALLRDGEVDVIDVRELDERDSGFIPGSKHVPYRLLRAYGASVSDGRPVVTICESGARAAVAASVLAAAGVDARPVLHGGITDWCHRGGHTVEFRRCGS
jgi:glyoxylase-like metal-dependent hydrolase (beta-lactamase superfamily II)/rhodanese-related sulfurtransferase